MGKSYKNRRKHLYKKNPYCPICGRKMILVDFGPHGGISGSSGRDRHNGRVATIDHINNRLNGSRPESDKPTTRLMCQRCNNMLQRHEFAQIPKEEQWKRTGGYPLNWNPLDAGLTTYKLQLRKQWGDT